MKIKEFLQRAFDKFMGTAADLPLDYALPTLKSVGGMNECDMECGTDPNSFYVLDSFALCPRAYLLKYLVKRPLSIPFFAEVQEAVRETVAQYVMDGLPHALLRSTFERLFDEFATKGSLPIFYPKKDWRGDWRREVGDYFANYAPTWEAQGWRAVEALYPVAGDIEGFSLKGVIDLVLKNREGEYALVAHDFNDVFMRKDGVVSQYEDQKIIANLSRKMYLYGHLFARQNAEASGCIKKIFLDFYHPSKTNEPFEIEVNWSPEDEAEAIAWVGRMVRGIADATETKQWPAAEILKKDKEGRVAVDRHFCQQRCPHCLSCRWAGWHWPELAKKFGLPENQIVFLPQKYIGAKIALKRGLDLQMPVLKYPGTFMCEDGKERKVSGSKSVLVNMGVQTIGDLKDKTILDFAATVGCGQAKLETLLGLFYDVTYL